jgi:transcriptional regulator with XRE-family HTH domain
MKVEIGQRIKDVFDSKDMKLTDFADQLGTVRQNVYRIFKKRHLDTGLLLKISKVLNHNFFQYYIDQPATIDLDESKKIEDLSPLVTKLEYELELAKKEILYLRKIIKLMEEKADLIQQIEKDIVIH